MRGDYVTKADEVAESDAKIAATKIDSVRGPPGAPIGYGVQKLSIEGGNPYAAKQIYRAEEPVPNLQHQPIILGKGVAPEAPAAPKLDKEMQYRRDVEQAGVHAEGASFDKLIAAGMTSGPKVRWSNSILDDVKDKDEKADKAKNSKVKADVNAGAPDAAAEVTPAKAKKTLEALAKDAPNPNAQPEDPATDPAAVAAMANKMEDTSSAKAAATDAAKAKAAPKAALSQMRGDYETAAEAAAIEAARVATTKVESVKGPPGAPIGYGVHKLSVEGGNPYAAKQIYRAEAPVPGVQHQPVMLPADFYRGPVAAPAALSPEMQYRKDAGEVGVKAEDATYGKLVAAGMTDTPKVRFNNSILAPAKDGEAVTAPAANVTKDAAPVAAPAAAAAAPDAAAAAEPAAVEKVQKAVAADAKAAPVAAALMQK